MARAFALGVRAVRASAGLLAAGAGLATWRGAAERGGGGADRGPARWLLARALLSLGRHDDAVATAQMAERELAEDGDGARDHAAARAWLAARAR